jgi:hypothetical protein
MAYGLHWEWRGFGALDRAGRRRIEELPRLFPGDLRGVDSYYWYPGCDVNLKLRDFGAGAGLKLKRLRAVDDEAGCQLWHEDEREDFPFPLQPEAVRRVAEALGVDVSPPPRPMGRRSLLTLLREARPDLVVVAVRKTRSVHCWAAGGREVLVDIAVITAPERVTSVAIEDRAGLDASASAEELAAAKADVLAAREALGLPGALTPASYLEAVGMWAAGGSVLRP